MRLKEFLLNVFRYWVIYCVGCVYEVVMDYGDEVLVDCLIVVFC